jgi:transcriptional regulator with GAF, ATPase, and Fis domain
VGEATQHDPTTERALGLAGAVLDIDALHELLQRVVLLALHTVGKAHSVSITVVDDGHYRTCNATADEAVTIDDAQYERQEGPCLHALKTAGQVQVRVADELGRWPVFAEMAMEMGIGSVLSTPMVRSPGDAIGALNIYARDDGSFSEHETRTAAVLGEHAAILVGNALALIGATHLNEQLRVALASREIIGEAKGIIMERQTCTRDEAFDILRRASQRENRKLRDLAEELVTRVEARRRDNPIGK